MVFDSDACEPNISFDFSMVSSFHEKIFGVFGIMRAAVVVDVAVAVDAAALKFIVAPHSFICW